MVEILRMCTHVICNPDTARGVDWNLRIHKTLAKPRAEQPSHFSPLFWNFLRKIGLGCYRSCEIGRHSLSTPVDRGRELRFRVEVTASLGNLPGRTLSRPEIWRSSFRFPTCQVAPFK